jgi:hypothetical protein
VKVLPCGHLANLGSRRLCRHLFGERADELDKVWVLRGVGVDYDLCCADCARDGRPELADACEGCTARAGDDRLSVVGVIGEPEIRRRPEPVNTRLRRSPLPAALLDAAPLASCPGQWLLLTREHLIRWHAGTGEVTGRWKITLPGTGPERKAGSAARYRLHAAPGGECAAVVVDYRQHGMVVDLAGGRTTMILDRGAYRVEQTPFPAAFTAVDGQVLLVHATAWNRVDLSDPVTGTLLTPRAFPAEAGRRFPPHYLGYFYGTLLPSPDGSQIVSDGWVWAPVGVPRAWAIRPWRHEYAHEPEDGDSVRGVRQVSYYWDKPMCWAGDTRLALGGIGADSQAMIPGVEIYDVTTGALAAAFAGPDGDLHCDGDQLYAAGPGGMTIWDIRTGETTGTVPGFTPTRYHAGSHELAAIDDTAMVIWPTRPDGT